MRKLINGIVDFQERQLAEYAEKFRILAERQKPDALFISCSDSRVVPNLLISTDPGDLFVIRNVGNLIPPATGDGHSSGDLSEPSAIEYALLVLGVTDLVVCGHSECGAMKAVLSGTVPARTLNLHRWLRNADTAAFRLEQEGPLDARLSPHDQLGQINVLVQIEHLMTYPLVREFVQSGKVRVSGWWFDIATASMHAYERTTRSFELIDRRQAERLLARLDEAKKTPARTAPREPSGGTAPPDGG